MTQHAPIDDEEFASFRRFFKSFRIKKGKCEDLSDLKNLEIIGFNNKMRDVSELLLNSSLSFIFQTFKTLSSRPYSLETLKLSGSNKPIRCAQSVSQFAAKNCKELKKIEFEFLYMPDCLAPFLVPTLTHVNLDHVAAMNGLNWFCLKNLKFLKLNATGNWGDLTTIEQFFLGGAEGIGFLSTAIKLSDLPPSLEDLDLTSFRLLDVMPVNARQNKVGFPNLKRLKLTEMPFSGLDIKFLTSNATKIQSIEYYECFSYYVWEDVIRLLRKF